MVQFVDSLKLSTDVVFMNLGVQDLNSGVLWITTKDKLGLFLPIQKKKCC
jgi:hypothetical protein